jgi:polysaccharide deacetylase family protein (PEP-CTERM system associated)
MISDKNRKVKYFNTNAQFFTIDVEDWFHILNAPIPSLSEWDSLPSIVEKGIYKILDILDENNSKATFFILGWIAKKYPSLVREIYNRGHEIASHGFYHKELYLLDHNSLVKEISDSREILEDIVGEKIIGFRAPGFSFKENYFFLLELLIDLGFLYDSSIFSMKRETGGDNTFESFPFIYVNGNKKIYEFPVSVYNKFIKIPFGGGYSRLLPRLFLKRIIKSHIKEKGYFMFYFHPREVIPNHPKLKNLSLKKYFQSYVGVRTFEKKVRDINKTIKSITIKDFLNNNFSS